MIYFIQTGGAGGPIKIGFTSRTSPAARMREMRTGCPDEYCLLGVIPDPEGTYKREQELHEQFAGSRIHPGEWFRPNAELLAFIAAMEVKVKAVRTQPKRPSRRRVSARLFRESEYPKPKPDSTPDTTDREAVFRRGLRAAADRCADPVVQAWARNLADNGEARAGPPPNGEARALLWLEEMLAFGEHASFPVRAPGGNR